MQRHHRRHTRRRYAYGLVVVALAGTLFTGVAPTATATEPHVRDYVDASYQLFLGRDATSAEVDGWAPVVNQGQRGAFTTALATSDEWAGVRIDDQYRRILRRPSDPGGRAYWLHQIQGGLRLEDVASHFYGSQEYWARADRSPATFVDNLYRDLLGRGSDATGRQYWIDQLDRGLTRSAVAANFYLSVESRTDRVTVLYHAVLGRGPDDAGLAYWADQLMVMGDISLSAWLAASDEFYLRVTGTMPAPRPALVTYTYEVRGRNNVGGLDTFAAQAAETFADPKGWGLGGSVAFQQVPSGGHFTLWLAAPGSVPSFSAACSAHWSCRVGRHVIINETRWNNATASWNAAGGSLRDYRHMVVNHEAGHFLGFGHANCGAPGQHAPVMQQQSINLQGCQHNGWPLDWERHHLANRLGVPIY